jgi:hypothetical protein
VSATITATLSSATANSYVTLAEANTYFETVPDSSTWTNKTDDQKNRSLISATHGELPHTTHIEAFEIEGILTTFETLVGVLDKSWHAMNIY